MPSDSGELRVVMDRCGEVPSILIAMAGTTPSWTEYRLEAFGEPYMVWHDGPDYSELERRWHADPAFVESRLMEGLEERDPLAAQAVARLPLPPDQRLRFVETLTSGLGQTPVGFHLRAAEALFLITGSQQWGDEIVLVLLGAGFWGDRLDAAIALAALAPTDALVTALAQGVQDPDYLVRYHAANTLLHFGGRAPSIADNVSLFSRVRADGAPAKWESASVELAAMATAKLARAAPSV